jgi:molybdopterin/thiamine biosynthesis adenylyltransferase
MINALELDRTGQGTPTSFTPDEGRLNNLLDDVWRPAGIRPIGLAHLHPAGCPRPSAGDAEYARTVLEAMPELPHFVMPIGCRDRAGRLQVRGFVAKRLPDGGVALLRVPIDAAAVGDEGDRDDQFARVRGAVDVDRLARSLVVVVGVGGAASAVENLARLGVGSFVLIDPDRVGPPNLATQAVYRRDLGRPKVSALGEHLRDISPRAAVRPIAKRIEDLDDDEFARILQVGETPPENRLLLGMTDSHPAQARVNRLALKLGVPSLCAQLYAEGRGGEITFVIPGTTSACHRCILHDRYDAFENGFENDVTTDGMPLFATTRMNATTEMMATAMLHRGTEHRWAKLLERLRRRQLVQFLMDDEIAPFDDGPGARNSERWNGLDDTVFVRTTPLAGCPDCGGTGDLRAMAGVVGDTRVAGGRRGPSAEPPRNAAATSGAGKRAPRPAVTATAEEVPSWGRAQGGSPGRAV